MSFVLRLQVQTFYGDDGLLHAGYRDIFDKMKPLIHLKVEHCQEVSLSKDQFTSSTECEAVLFLQILDAVGGITRHAGLCGTGSTVRKVMTSGFWST